MRGRPESVNAMWMPCFLINHSQDLETGCLKLAIVKFWASYVSRENTLMKYCKSLKQGVNII